MKTHTHIIICLCLLFSALQPAKAQEQFGSRYNIAHVTMENGLLHNFIDDIYKDSRGFLWISTGGGGLSRYDGYEFTHYNINTPDAKLKSNFIRESCEDNFSRLWIVSEGGIDILDLSSHRIVTLDDPHKQFSTLSKQGAIRIEKDTKGAIWIAGGSTLYKIAFNADGSIASLFLLPTIPNTTTQDIAMSDIDEDGNIWIGFNGNIYKVYTTDEGTLKPIPVSANLEFNPGTIIGSFCVKENEVWIATDQGLVRYNRNEQIVKRYEHDRNNHRSISQNLVTDLSITSDKQLLVCTLKGLNIYNPITDDFDRISQDSGPSDGCLNSNFINCIKVDGDIIWLGTETGGLNKMTPRKLTVRNYINSKENPYSISQNPVNAIYEDNKGNLWVGTVEGGLNRKPNESERFYHYTSEGSSRLSHNSVSAITADGNNRLWVGTWGNGINILDLEHPELPVKKYISSEAFPGFPVDFIGSLCYDPINKGMWIGANQGIYFYDIETDKLHIPFSTDATTGIYGFIGSIIDQNGLLWMGSMEGMYVVKLHSRADNRFDYAHLKYKLDDPDSHLTERISCFYQDSEGTLWIGSNGCGLYKHLPGTNGDIGRFVGYTTEQGLINNSIRGILEDDRNQLWISTNNGLSCFNPTTGKFTNYTKNDGLASSQFYWNAYCRSQNGLLYFGSIEGLSAIDSNRRITKQLPVPVALTRLSVMNEEIMPGGKYIRSDIATAQTVHLHEKDKSFSLEFAALNYEIPATAVYSYRLAGFDKQWINVPASRRFASYTNLKPGKYTFQVKYSADETTNNNPVTELQVVVKPFFYKTGWFISLMALLTVCLVVYIYLRRIYTLQAQKERLHKKVEERTRELNEQNEILTRQNEKITQQKAQLIKMSKKVQELTMDKISFFTSITHEFRTPITLILGPIERALKLSYNPQVIEQLNFVERNSKYLLSLVNQLMDFRKVESGKMEITKTKSNFARFISSLTAPFEAFASDRQITIKTYIRLASPDFLFDPDAMQKVITNLLSNAIKFTPDGGTVSLYAASVHDKETGNEKLYLCVRDTGTGISEEDLAKIFNRFYQSANHVKYPVYGQSGTGIGLYLCKQIVRAHGGSIQAFNNKSGGSSFRILLSLQRTEGVTQDLTIKDPILINKEDSQLPAHFVPGRLAILVVEDNSDMRSYIRSILIEHYNILEAENGEKALAILSQNSVDFIISDLMMPVMDGIELSRRVRENFAISHIPFLMLTAKTSQEARLESYKKGVDAYLMKPFNDELLLARITNILENRKRYQRQFANNMDVTVLNMEEESSDKKFLDKALEVIRENYKNSYYEAADFIDAMGVSKSLLNKKLQTLTGQSIGQFIRNYRLNIARELIEKNKVTRNMNISEIAYEVGFNDPKYFTRCFTKRFNVPPSSLMEE